LFKRILAGALGLTEAFVSATGAFAGSHVVAQKSTTRHNSAIYLSHSLSPRHAYYVGISAYGRKAFSGYATEFYVGVQSGRVFTGNANVAMSGTTPHTFRLKQPAAAGVRQWSVAITLRLTSGGAVTVRLVDLGARR